MWASSQLGGVNAPYLDGLYEDYLRDATAVDPNWRVFFDSLPRTKNVMDTSHAAIRESFRGMLMASSPGPRTRGGTFADKDAAAKQAAVLRLINAYRFRGHQTDSFNPLPRKQKPDLEEFTLEYHGLSEDDLDTEFNIGSLVGPEKATLREILEIVTDTYTGSLVAEYMYISNTVEKRWIQNRLEGPRCKPGFSEKTKKRVLERVTAAERLERYLHSKYIGQKRFSLEGAETLIPMLDELIQRAGVQKIKEVVIGMAHRGRLNVLVNVMGKMPSDLFKEFEGGQEKTTNGSGDVKYHMGFSSNISTRGGDVHIVLAFNPSHLEIVGPVVEGSVRARQDRRSDKDGSEVIPLLIHGDAAFAGQGVIMETFNMSQSRGYSIKGTVHIVVNNQIGFTTSDQQDARSSLHCTDVAKMVDAPIFHVDGDNPEAVVFAAQVALDYRMTFRKDVVIDLVCYRRHGHSEADEPMATQPMMYKNISKKPTTRELYAKKLEDEGVIATGEATRMMEAYRKALEEGDSMVADIVPHKKATYPFAVDWSAYLANICLIDLDTSISQKKVHDLTERLLRLPQGFELHSSVAKIMGNRHKMAAGSLPIDWGFAETMAFASLVTEGYGVRLSGQDSGRGTFFHRHAVLYDQKDSTSYIPLRNLSDTQANFLVINSLLSEEAVLAFEYGYSTTDPKTLAIWEAQFGDFTNNAQVVIDQFISAGEQKWTRLSGLVMLLPHGYEGQGPEHSSARLERFLQLCAEHNMQVCVPTTPSQIFHLLRRQMMQTCRKPLVIMSPKSLLRHRLAVSSLDELCAGPFKMVIPETEGLDNDKVERVVMCSGKVYYDLIEKRSKAELHNVAIIRMEQVYPFPKNALTNEFKRYPNTSKFVWCQEEPKNQGAWYSSQHHMRALIGNEHHLEYAGRPTSAAPAVGYALLHIKQQHRLVDDALGVES